MDYLKTRAPFWKKEDTPAGARWVEARGTTTTPRPAGTRRGAASERDRDRKRRGTPRVGTAALIAIDWGTTSARAYRLDASRPRRRRASAPLGIQQVRDGAFAAALVDAARRLGRRAGAAHRLRHDRQPAGLDRSAVPRVPGGARRARRGPRHARRTARSRIVPGVTLRDAAGVPDVMRGEETQILGAIAGGTTPARARRSSCCPARTASGRASATADRDLRDVPDRRAATRCSRNTASSAG